MKIPKARQLASGTWFIQLRLNGMSVPVSAPTKAECIRAAQLIKAEHQAGKLTVEKTNRITLSDAIDAYIERRKSTLSPSTVDGYRRIQRNRFQSVMRSVPLRKIDWQSVCDAESKIVSPKTLRNAYRFAVSVMTDNGITPKKITLPALNSEVRKWLTAEQIPKLIEEADGTPAALPVFLGLHSLRRSEMLALTWDDIDLDNRTIYVKGAIVQDESHKFVRRDVNKTVNSMRVVPIMIPELLVMLSSTPKDERAGPLLDCKPHAIADRINAACRRAGLPEVGTHGLRHSFASLARHVGLSELETMEIGGWSDPQTMRKIYTHLSAADRLKAENKMSAFYNNANKTLTTS